MSSDEASVCANEYYDDSVNAGYYSIVDRANFCHRLYAKPSFDYAESYRNAMLY